MDFLAFVFATNFLAFLSVFPFFPRDFRGSEERINPCFFGWFSFSQKKQGKEDQGRHPPEAPLDSMEVCNKVRWRLRDAIVRTTQAKLPSGPPLPPPQRSPRSQQRRPQSAQVLGSKKRECCSAVSAAQLSENCSATSVFRLWHVAGVGIRGVGFRTC